jgi:beta-lactamase regulating signal transducer with metallopeptidase domain
MLLKSIIFALAGLIAAFVLTVFKQRKFNKLKELQAKTEEETRNQLQREWTR